MCPIVPTFTCGFVRSYFALAIPDSPRSAIGSVARHFSQARLGRRGASGFGRPPRRGPPAHAPRSTPEATAVEMVGRGGFEPPKACASRFTVCPLWPLGYLPEPNRMLPKRPKRLELARGFEPPTRCLQGSRSTSELRQHRQNSMLLSDPLEVNGFFISSRPLAQDLVADHRASRRHVEGADPPA